MSERRCAQGHAMQVVSRFRFDHEPDDTAEQTASLELFQRMGIHLGDDVTVWRCEPCNEVEAIFTTPAPS